MRLRTFIAADMADAIEMVRTELGSDAIIISSHVNEAGRTVVSAAIEADPHARDDLRAPQSVAAISSAPSLEIELERRLRDRLSAMPTRANAPLNNKASSSITFDADQMAAALSAQAVPTNLRDALVNAAASFRDEDAVSALSRALEARFNFEPIATSPRAPIMLVGLPGSGKTVTMAKLAANAVMSGCEVDLISTDTARAGAAEQGTAYGKLLGQSFTLADNVDALTLLLEEQAASGNGLPNRNERPCFIDTGSVNPFDRVEWDALKRIVDHARSNADVEPVLVMSATGDAELMCEVATHFALLGIRRLVATQVDISRRIGALLAAADVSRLSLAQLSVTPYLAQGLNPMHPAICAKLLLSGYATSKNNETSAPQGNATS